MEALSPKESQIIRSMLVKQYGPHSLFLDQLTVARVENRRMTGVGVFVNLSIPERAARVDAVDTEISNGYRTLLDVPCDLIGFTLFIREGCLSFLEGYTFGDVKWPEQSIDEWLVLDADEDQFEGKSAQIASVGLKPAATSITDAVRRRYEGQLREQLRQDCDDARKIGYNPSLFLAMLSKHGPIEACRQVIMASKIPDGFMRLLELNRLELTAEATVLRGPWRRLFSQAVLKQARGRLIAYGRGDLTNNG